MFTATPWQCRLVNESELPDIVHEKPQSVSCCCTSTHTRVMLCLFRLCLVMLCLLRLCHVISCLFKLCHVTHSCHVMPV